MYIPEQQFIKPARQYVLKKSEPRTDKGRVVKEVKSNITDNDSAKMTSSKGTIQGCNGIAAVDKKHQVVVLAKTLGEGQEHHSLQPVLADIKDRFRCLKISNNLYKQGTVITADTRFANETNMKYVKTNSTNAYIPDNQFSHRMSVVEPVFGNLTSNKGLKRFSVRGKSKVK